ncbi:unnamed protein product [Echinostoma caproni]|uniref:Reverse transcriptase domain-containing protein n=1 Tax=Echinostoma caproni TaxID=27848 RepID=A0A183BCC1_9TREM|nr:unnamed protein product [Echinostoma caproni]
MLFPVNINDMVRGLHSPLYLFADDVKIVGRLDVPQLQEDLNKIQEWTVQRELLLNLSKCQQLMSVGTISNGRSATTEKHLPLKRNDDIRDLGIVIDQTFKPTPQCLAAAAKSNMALHLLERKRCESSAKNTLDEAASLFTAAQLFTQAEDKLECINAVSYNENSDCATMCLLRAAKV